MRVKLGTRNLGFELEGEDLKQLFEKVAEIQELFSDDVCGACGSENTILRVRTVDDNKYYEMVCCEQGCRATKAFGQMKKGGKLFPKRKDKEGGWLPNNGWVKFSRTRDDDKDEDEDAEVAPPPKAKTGTGKKTTKKVDDDDKSNDVPF